MDKILDVMEDIKQNITDNQYKTIMDSLMVINKDPNLYKNHKAIKNLFINYTNFFFYFSIIILK